MGNRPTKESPCGGWSIHFCKPQPKRTAILECDDTTTTTEESMTCSSTSDRLSRSASWFSMSEERDYTPAELQVSEASIYEDSDFSIVRPVYIVTTAALPWMTGTAVNPVLRAAYLALYHEQLQKQQDKPSIDSPTVHLVIPWLESAEDRVALYGSRWEDATSDDQEQYIQGWIAKHVGSVSIQLHWYSARYHVALGSIFAVTDVCADLDPHEEDAVCILEEPEHLNYYRGGHWRIRFRHVVGIIHTNYCVYAQQKTALAVPLIGAISAWMVRAYCDKVIQLSATLPAYAPEKEMVCNVHGVRREFLQEYKGGNGIYFLGKLLWAKGLDRLLKLQNVYKQATGSFFSMDIYGSGPEQDEIQAAFTGSNHVQISGRSFQNYWLSSESKETESDPLPVTFMGRVDHAAVDNCTARYRTFVNPSISEVLCTVTAEAIAMGKFVIIPHHPSNTFFEQFDNCRTYRNDAEFVEHMIHCQLYEPAPLNEASRDALTWEGATERLIHAATISHREAARRDRLLPRDQRLADFHIQLGQGTRGDVLRKALGAGPVAKQMSRSSSASSTSTEVSPASVAPITAF